MATVLPQPSPSKYDRLFKEIVTAGWAVKSDGHVESPQGHFAVVEVPSNFAEFNDMVDAVDPDHEYSNDDWPSPGWYFVVEDSDGLAWVYSVTQHVANLLFGEYQDAFVKWDGE